MDNKRRKFLKSGLLAGVGSAFAANTYASDSKSSGASDLKTDYSQLDAALEKPVFKKELFSEPVLIESCDLLNYEGNYMIRVRSKDGAVGYCVGHNYRMPHLYPIQLMRVNPYFIGKDARDLDRLMEEIYMFENNYKYQGYPVHIPIATVEMAILDMMGRIAKKSMGELIGDIHNTEIAIYRANNNRGKSAEESIERTKAVKFKIGGRRDIPESPTGRTEALIPLMRKNFGDDITIYADCNGSYESKEAIRIGKMLEKYDIDLFEQPVPTDYYEDWKETADALSIPIASGGGEVSLRNFRWLIGNGAVQMVQQDLFYFGGMVRCMKVARMAAAKGYPCTPHISGTGLGYIYMMHFVSALPNAGPFHEFKGVGNEVPYECETSTLVPENGILHLPRGIGSGVEIDPGFISKHKVMKV
jgi:L-alanine-DL-glutamate epimerase-like enolase superfamily enzyme